MFLTGKKEINIIEYTCTSARKTRARLKIDTSSTVSKKIELTPLRLAVAMARTILSAKPNDIEYLFQGISAYFNIQILIDSSKKNLRIKNESIEKYRDFSLSSRIGELAQGINYLFAQEILKYPIVLDFQNYIKTFKPSVSYCGESPDFIICGKESNKIAILESKGSCPSKINFKLKSTIKYGLEQCKSAENFIKKHTFPVSVQNSYASGVWFSSSSKSWESAIHFSDPSNDNEIDTLDYHKMLRIHYSTWFTMLGYIKLANELLSDSTIEIVEPYKSEIYEGNTYILFESNSLFYPVFKPDGVAKSNFLEKNVIFGLAERVLKLIQSPHSQNSLNEDTSPIFFEPISNDDVELFADGTIAFYNHY
ncbi:hypothetical protein LY28_02792 [Ruminiclostridium sufflavum DSM 19573]|uniref:Uncharacterized protein n=1 Tax=Ruminiclostridium sufflavum DSM 19573 TaxID=1121337 RepID=A0A318XJQ5_9FIRM|nr:hypothetical protein [Ruminiclostridium sufflavum]PYG86766.1 hypothetical protein LY28_02792 [Ruminiclostridium sufflavum DSM 19573]